MADVRDILEWDVDVQAESGSAPNSSVAAGGDSAAQQMLKKEEIIGAHATDKKQVGGREECAQLYSTPEIHNVECYGYLNGAVKN